MLSHLLHRVNHVSVRKLTIVHPKHDLFPFKNQMHQCNLFYVMFMPVDKDGYKLILVVGDLFSKYIEAIPLKEQSADSVMQALRDTWILRYGCPLYVLSDQCSNVDGNVLRELCETFNIKKKRSSAYHSQGNGFAERSVRNIREMMRTLLEDRKLPQAAWQQLLRGIVFALNTSISESTKMTPYEVVYGKSAILPIDVIINASSSDDPGTLSTVSEYARELKKKLTETYEIVRNNLNKSREGMKKQYDKNVRINRYTVGDKVWLKNKYFKSGVSKKLAARRNGPWTIEQILPNGVNFLITRTNPYKKLIVHHDRITPFKSSAPYMPSPEPITNALELDMSSENESREGEDETLSSDNTVSDNEHNEMRRYPLRNRVPTRIEGAIPWDSIQLDE